MNENSSNDSLDQLLAHYLRRIDAGEKIDREMLQAEQPQHADSLIELIETTQLINEMAGPTLEEDEEAGGDDDAEPHPSGAMHDGPPPLSRPASTTVKEIPLDPNRHNEETLDLFGSTNAGATLRAEPLEREEEAESLVGHVFDDYQILSVLGQGGMGVVYKARQISMDRIVALKMILGGRFASSEDVQRFYTEAQAAGRTGHPNIVNVYEVDRCEGQHYFSMEYVEGVDLAVLAKEGPLAPKRAARYLKTIAEAVHAAHQSGVLHRDLKPANVLIDVDDRPRVTDFGLAKQVDDDSGLTASGAAVGTPSYMSPEQASGLHKSVSARTDIYSLGAILYVMLTGNPPFRAATSFQTIMEVINAEPVPPVDLNRDADIDLQTICLKCLSKDPEDRYESAEELADELTRFLSGQPILAKPRGMIESARLWLLNVPLIAAASGRLIVHATPAHQRFQAGMVLLCLLTPLASYFLISVWRQTLPSRIVIASGPSGGAYHALAASLQKPIATHTQRPAVIRESRGSAENNRLLLEGQSHLAFLQASDVADLKVQRLAIVAPVYYEAVHVIVRTNANIKSFEELRGRRVSLGVSAGSSMHASSSMVLEHYRMKPEMLKDHDRNYHELATHSDLDACIVTMGVGSDSLRELLADRRFELLPLADGADFEHPTLRAFTIKADTYGAGIPPSHVRTVATPAFLVANRHAPNALIKAALDSLYELPPAPGRVSRRIAAEWPGLALHPAAQRFFETAP